MVDPGGPLISRQRKHHSKSDNLLGIMGVGLKPRGAATHGLGCRASSHHAPRGRSLCRWMPYTIIGGRAIVGVVPRIGAPFPQVAVHIVQAEGIGRKLIDLGGGVTIDTFRFGAIDELAVVVGDLGREGFAKMEGC